MLATALLALLPALALASPIQKRYTGVHIVSGRNGQCLGAAPKTGSGSPVQTVDCANTNYAINWDINPGSGSVILSGSNNPQLALDAGSNPGNFGQLKVWQSYPTLYQQTWFLTGDNRIAITGGDQCLDEGDNGVQTYQCTTGNTNQVWYIKDGSGGSPPVSSSTSASASSTSASSTSAPSSTSSAGPTPTGGVFQIRHQDRCVTVQNGYAAIDTTVADSDCFGDANSLRANPGDFGKLQLWNVPPVGTQGHITSVANPGLCLDAGNNPADGSGLKIYTCYDGLLQQEWTVKSDGSISLANNQCVDERAESGPIQRKPYGSLKDLQTWQCYPGNGNQYFSLQ